MERVSAKLEYYQQMESTMQNTLVIAQETADEVKKNSEQKAALLEQETAMKCKEITSECQAAAAKAKWTLKSRRLRPGQKQKLMLKNCAAKLKVKLQNCVMTRWRKLPDCAAKLRPS